MATINIDGDKVPVVYTNELQLAVYPDFDLEPGGFVEQEQARYAGQPVHEDVVKRLFWWYRYLLLNRDYAECCKKKGEGSQQFYADWGDIFALPFPEWWERHGKRLAGLEGFFVEDVSDSRAIEVLRGKPSYLMVAVNLDTPGSRHQLYNAVTNIVRTRIDERERSRGETRLYRTEENFRYQLLHWAYEAYVGKTASELDEMGATYEKVAELIGVETSTKGEDPARKVYDLKNAAEEIIRNAFELARFPVHGRRKASRA
jgi:hypothetical protein